MTAKTANQGIEELARQAKAGDRDAFSQIVRAMMNKVVALTYRMTGDRQTAMDLAQEAFIAAWTRISQFRGDAKFTSWLYRIATNVTLNHLRRQSGRQEVSIDDSLPETASSHQDTPEVELNRSELRRAVIQFMQELPPQQRTVFELRFYQEMSFEEISKSVGKAVGTVKTHYRQAIIKLRAWAEKEGWKP